MIRAAASQVWCAAVIYQDVTVVTLIDCTPLKLSASGFKEMHHTLVSRDPRCGELRKRLQISELSISVVCHFRNLRIFKGGTQVPNEDGASVW